MSSSTGVRGAKAGGRTLDPGPRAGSFPLFFITELLLQEIPAGLVGHSTAPTGWDQVCVPAEDLAGSLSPEKASSPWELAPKII